VAAQQMASSTVQLRALIQCIYISLYFRCHAGWQLTAALNLILVYIQLIYLCRTEPLAVKDDPV
jgi:hypothetical protein